MTVQAGIELDLELMMGDLPAQPCESTGHNLPCDAYAHGGHATHYVKVLHDCSANTEKVIAVCSPFALWYATHALQLSPCDHCKAILRIDEFIIVLGPISDYR